MRSNSIFKLFFSLILVFVTSISNAFTLEQYIRINCSKHCVNADLLYNVIHRAGRSFGVNPKVLLAIIEVESNFSIRARNGKSVGIAQIFVKYHKDKFKGKDYYHVESNVFAGAEILGECLDKYKGSYPKALSCYNGLPPSNLKYSNKVMKTMKKQSVIRLEPPGDHLQEFLVKQKLLVQTSSESSIHETESSTDVSTVAIAE